MSKSQLFSQSSHRRVSVTSLFKFISDISVLCTFVWRYTIYKRCTKKMRMCGGWWTTQGERRRGHGAAAPGRRRRRPRGARGAGRPRPSRARVRGPANWIHVHVTNGCVY